MTHAYRVKKYILHLSSTKKRLLINKFIIFSKKKFLNRVIKTYL
jgi:hypothetical protein